MKESFKFRSLMILFMLITVFLLPKAGYSEENEIRKSLQMSPSKNIPVCSSDFAKSLNKDNTVIWVNDPKFPKSACCINGRVCQPYPSYKQYVVANASIQPEYDCERIAKNSGYTPICQIKVGEALDPTTLCTDCVPYAFTFWAPVYQNNTPPPPPDPCASIKCTEGYYCDNGKCIYNPCYNVSCPGGYSCVQGTCVQLPFP